MYPKCAISHRHIVPQVSSLHRGIRALPCAAVRTRRICARAVRGPRRPQSRFAQSPPET